MAKARPTINAALAGLVSDVAGDARVPDVVRKVPASSVDANPFQPRRTFDDATLASLAESIRAEGLLSPLLVRPHPTLPDRWQLADGERRLRAARLAGLADVEVVARPMTDDALQARAAIANLQREDLNVIDEVDAIVTLVARTLGAARSEVPARLAALERTPDDAVVPALEALFAQLGTMTWQSFLKNKLRVLRWPSDVLTAMREAGLPYTHAAVAAAIREDDTRARLLARWAAQPGMSAAAWRAEAQALTTPSAPVETTWALSQRVARDLARKRLVQRLPPDREARLRQLMEEVRRLLDDPA